MPLDSVSEKLLNGCVWLNGFVQAAQEAGGDVQKIRPAMDGNVFMTIGHNNQHRVTLVVEPYGDPAGLRNAITALGRLGSYAL